MGSLSVGRGAVRELDPINGALRYDASTSPGPSGAPVLSVEDGKIEVVGMHSRGLKPIADENYYFPRYNRNQANEFTNASVIFGRADVKAILDQDKAAFGGPNPLLQRMSQPLPKRPLSRSENQ